MNSSLPISCKELSAPDQKTDIFYLNSRKERCNPMIYRVTIGILGTLALGVAWAAPQFRAYVLDETAIKDIRSNEPAILRMLAGFFGTLALGIPWFFSSFSRYVCGKRPREIDREAKRDKYGNVKGIKLQGPFYHATGGVGEWIPITGKQNLEAILKYGGVKITHQQKYRGAFVSQVPEFESFGKIVLVFRQAITRHKDGSPRSYLHKIKPISYNIRPDNHIRWIGFAKRLPTKEQYLAGIILKDYLSSPEKNEQARASLERDVERWAGRKITVELNSNLSKLKPENIKHSIK